MDKPNETPTNSTNQEMAKNEDMIVNIDGQECKIDRSKCIKVKLGNSSDGLDLLFDMFGHANQKQVCFMKRDYARTAYRQELNNVMNGK